MTGPSEKSRGTLIAQTLAGSWRPEPELLQCTPAELADIATQLIASGTAGLTWRRARHSELANTKICDELHDAYCANTIQAAIQERRLTKAVSTLRSAGIDPLLVKGWAVARLYPARGLRPYADIDLCVHPKDYRRADQVLAGLESGHERVASHVDLHSGFEKFGGGSTEGFLARSSLVELGTSEIRVPSLEDHLRILCVHFLREGAWRPLWLCDIASLVETRPATFNWDACLTNDRRLSEWINSTMRLAEQLLGADLSGTPAEETTDLPAWLVDTVLKEWEARLPAMMERHRAPMATYLAHVPGALKGMRDRWPNPIEATISVRGPINQMPRLPMQLGSYLGRSAKFVTRLPKLLRQR